METLVLNSLPLTEAPLFPQRYSTDLLNGNKEKIAAYEKPVEKLGPVCFTGRSPFKILVMILTRYKPAMDDEKKVSGSFITYVGYKKEHDLEYDFDEMIPSLSQEEAIKTHDRACGFFSTSSLFIKSH